MQLLLDLLFGLLVGLAVGWLFPAVLERGRQWRRQSGKFVYPMHNDYPARAAMILCVINLLRAFFSDSHYFASAWWLLWVAIGAFIASRNK